MKKWLCALAIAMLPSGLPAADDPPKDPPNVPPKAAETAPATPEAFVEQIESLLNSADDDGTPENQKELAEFWKKQVGEIDHLIAEFRKRFGTHPLRWKVLLLEAQVRDVREEMQLPIPKESRPAKEVYAEILAAADADPEIKAEASAARLVAMADDVAEKKVTVEEWEKQLEKHLRTFTNTEDNMMLIELRLMLVEEHANKRFLPLLEALAKNANAEIAEMAKSRIAMEKTKTEIKSRPLDLKFTALDGSEFDISKLRGKVVLIDFWASWCAPCVEGLPALLKTYARFKEKGLEVVGISLDEEEPALKKIVKANAVPWPQYFDGKGWENPYAKKYGVEDIPTIWLVNKAGMVVEMDLAQKEGLDEKIEKLLGE